ncbi:LamG domain-containing protein [Sulfolobus tengchongensis]
MLAAAPLILDIREKKANIAQASSSLTSTYPYITIVEGNPNTGYSVITSSGEIFNGSCSSGSGTCGIYEAIQYLQKNYNGGLIVLLGQFYPIKSPLTSTPNNIQISGGAQIYVNPGSAPMIIALAPIMEYGIQLLWYSNIGIINSILSKRRSFSQSPYVLFYEPPAYQSLMFANGPQAFGTPSQFTVSAWVYGLPGGYDGYILAYGSLEAGQGWAIMGNSGMLMFTGSSGSIRAPFPSTVPFHVVVTYDNGTAIMYVNGNQVASGTVTINYPNVAYLWVNNCPIQSQQGGMNRPSWYSYLENIQIYNAVLSSSQIATLASSPTQDVVGSPIFWGLYRYVMYFGDLITGLGFQRMGAIFEGGVI